MSTFSIINEDFLDDLVQDATLNEPVVQNEINDFRFAVVIDGTSANEYVKPILKILKSFPEVNKNVTILHSRDSETSRNESFFDTSIPLKVHWTSKIAICFNASFRTSRSIMLFMKHLHEAKQQQRVKLYVLANKKWEDTMFLSNNSLYELLFNKQWNKNYPYSLNDLIESPDQLRKNTSYIVDIWRYMLDMTPVESFMLCERHIDIMRLISLTAMERNIIMRSTKYSDVDVSFLNGKKVLNKSVTGRMLRLDPWSFENIADEYYVKKAQLTIVNVYPYTSIVLLAYCGDDKGTLDWMYSQHNYDAERPCFAYSKELIGWSTPEEMSEKKQSLAKLYHNMFDITESESASLVEKIWTTSGLDKDRWSVYDN